MTTEMVKVERADRTRPSRCRTSRSWMRRPRATPDAGEPLVTLPAYGQIAAPLPAERAA